MIDSSQNCIKYLTHHQPKMSKTLLITGATGKQGGSVIAALLKAKADFEILAVTRDASSGGAQNLLAKSSNIKVVEGISITSTRSSTALGRRHLSLSGVFSVFRWVLNDEEFAPQI